jgi:menaquinone-specific isochorismate synthase
VTAQLSSVETLAARFEAALVAGSHAATQIVTVTIPAPPVDASRVFDQDANQFGYLFATGDKNGDVGLGSVARLRASHLGDLAALETEAQSLLERPFEVGIDAAARAPRFYGGINYSAARDPQGPWRAFDRVHFDLPRYRYLTDGKQASLTLHVRPAEIAQTSNRRSWFAQTDRLLSEIAVPSPPKNAPAIRQRRDDPSPAQWLCHVEDALAEVKQGTLEKVVLAREVLLELDAAPDVVRLLENLNVLSPETTRFAIRQDRCVFLGATPERLILRLGSELRTEAVAGSMRALDPDAAAHLMASEKERHEHDLVVRELLRKLEILGARPESPSRPAIRQLRHVIHLNTSVTARLFGPPHILTLMSRLHPTAAVGGVPEDRAAQFVREHEAFDRGCYAAPIGWFDAQGDGQFFVALRSGLLEGNHLRLYAGAGIVRDSQPEKELEETELKLQSLLEALGAVC